DSGGRVESFAATSVRLRAFARGLAGRGPIQTCQRFRPRTRRTLCPALPPHAPAPPFPHRARGQTDKWRGSPTTWPLVVAPARRPCIRLGLRQLAANPIDCHGKALPAFKLQPLKLAKLPPGIRRLLDFRKPPLRDGPLPGKADIVQFGLNLAARFLWL